MFFHKETGILMASSVILFNYNSSNPSQWYNHTFNRLLTVVEIFENPSNDEPPPIFLIILLITSIIIGSIAAILLYLRYHEGEVKEPLKHNPKSKPQIKNRKKSL